MPCASCDRCFFWTGVCGEVRRLTQSHSSSPLSAKIISPIGVDAAGYNGRRKQGRPPVAHVCGEGPVRVRRRGRSHFHSQTQALSRPVTLTLDRELELRADLLKHAGAGARAPVGTMFPSPGKRSQGQEPADPGRTRRTRPVAQQLRWLRPASEPDGRAQGQLLAKALPLHQDWF